MKTVTVSPYGFPMEVAGEFSPCERPILFPTDHAHPGSPAEFAITEVRVNGQDIKDMLDDDQYLHIEDSVLQALSPT